MKNLVLVAIAAFALLQSAVSFAGSKNLNEDDIRKILNGYELSVKQIDSIIDHLKKGPGNGPKKPLSISGVLFAHGLEASFFASTWNWDFNATFRDPETDKLVEIPKMYRVHYKNGGLAIGAGYTWIFAFVPAGNTVDSLDGAIFGRGLGLTFDPGIGLNVQWLPGNNRPGNVFVVAPEIGITGGLRFPKMQFTLKHVN